MFTVNHCQWILFSAISYGLIEIIKTEDNAYDEYDYVEIDPCKNFFETEEAKNCHHRNLPNETLQEKFGPDAKFCCSEGRSYRFFDSCPTRHSTYSTFACGSVDGEPKVASKTLTCPKHCKLHYLEDADFTVDGGGKIEMKNNVKGISLGSGDYCLYYDCDTSWSVKAEVCLCIQETRIQEINTQLPLQVTKCCSQVNFFNLEASPENGSERVDCLIDTSGPSINPCSYSFKKIDVDLLVSVRDSVISYREIPIPQAREFQLSKDSSDYCFGIGFNNIFSLRDPLKKYLMYCRPPCVGKSPCLRFCCSPDHVFNAEGFCEPRVANSTNFVLNLFNNSEKVYMDKVPLLERKCPQGYARKPLLDPLTRCRDKFEIFLEVGRPQLKITSTSKILNETEFCVDETADNLVVAEICRRVENFRRFEFYPYILLASSLFLLLTVITYSVFPILLNHFTRLMRHLALTMMLGFIVLAVNQLVAISSLTVVGCYISGFLQQYFFLSMFFFMTSMGVEIWFQVRSKPSCNERYLREVISGYFAPLCIVVMTLIVEFTAPRCAALRPRFGEEHCFFTERESKALWFYAPIGFLLATNAIIFVATVIQTKKIHQDSLTASGQTENKKKIAFQRFFLFLKLFIGLGLIWTMEIVAGLSDELIHESSWYFTDILNMLQGFYIFVIFVLNRKVLRAIKKRGMEDVESSKENDIVLGSLGNTN